MRVKLVRLRGEEERDLPSQMMSVEGAVNYLRLMRNPAEERREQVKWKANMRKAGSGETMVSSRYCQSRRPVKTRRGRRRWETWR